MGTEQGGGGVCRASRSTGTRNSAMKINPAQIFCKAHINLHPRKTLEAQGQEINVHYLIKIRNTVSPILVDQTIPDFGATCFVSCHKD